MISFISRHVNNETEQKFVPLDATAATVCFEIPPQSPFKNDGVLDP